MKKIEKIELLIAVILIVIFGGILIYSKIAVKKSESLQIDKTVKSLQNENRFFSIDSSISKYVTAVSNKDTNSIMKLLSKSYINKNNITENNVFNIIESYSEYTKSNTREVYQIKSYNNIYYYYSKVKLEEETFDSTTYLKTVYFKVMIDENKLVFNIEPISETIYLNKIKGATDEEQ